MSDAPPQAGGTPGAAAGRHLTTMAARCRAGDSDMSRYYGGANGGAQ